MSFLTYTSHPVLFAASVGGVTLGVTLLLLPWKQISFGDSWSNSFLSSRGINSSSSRGPIERENNCKVVSGLEKVIRFISANPLDYISISCKNEGEGDDKSLVNNWVALFHKNLFQKDKSKLAIDYPISIKTTTLIYEKNIGKDSFLINETRFQSEQFSKGDIKGYWEYGEFDIDGKTVDHVELEEPYSSEKIYFVHESKKR